jgi:proteasome lid subunit RPN8/RPN11
MKNKPKAAEKLKVLMEGEVARMIRQHGRSSMKAEVCGVLIGREEPGATFVDACIPGVNAAQGGAHVTFTQETWEHIYRIKDQKYPDDRIVGWYHSHPGFGVFLSEHDLFIQEHFFSSPQQIAWVYDPHTDEEGCFGWRAGKVEKLSDLSFAYVCPIGEVRELGENDGDSEASFLRPHGEGGREKHKNWVDYLFDVSTYFVIFALGFLVCYGLFLVPAVNQNRQLQSENSQMRDILTEIERRMEMVRKMQPQGSPDPNAMPPAAAVPPPAQQPVAQPRKDSQPKKDQNGAKR